MNMAAEVLVFNTLATLSYCKIGVQRPKFGKIGVQRTKFLNILKYYAWPFQRTTTSIIWVHFAQGSYQ